MHDLKRCQRYLFEKREMYDMVIRQLMEIAEEARYEANTDNALIAQRGKSTATR